MQRRGNPGCALYHFRHLSKSMDEQIDEDTCTAHGEFCCPQCFNMEPMGDPIDVPNED